MRTRDCLKAQSSDGLREHVFFRINLHVLTTGRKENTIGEIVNELRIGMAHNLDSEVDFEPHKALPLLEKSLGLIGRKPVKGSIRSRSRKQFMEKNPLTPVEAAEIAKTLLVATSLALREMTPDAYQSHAERYMQDIKRREAELARRQ